MNVPAGASTMGDLFVDYIPWTVNLIAIIVAAMKSRMEKICKTLGENVKASRLAMGISQEELAFRAELDRTYISQIERGVGNPSLGVLVKISTVLSAEISELLNPRNA